MKYWSSSELHRYVGMSVDHVQLDSMSQPACPLKEKSYFCYTEFTRTILHVNLYFPIDLTSVYFKDQWVV